MPALHRLQTHSRLGKANIRGCGEVKLAEVLPFLLQALVYSILGEAVEENSLGPRAC